MSQRCDNTGSNFAKSLERARNRPEYEAEGLKLKIADALIRRIDEKGVSRSELAKRMDVSAAYISKVFKGHENLSLETMVKLAFAVDSYWEPALFPLGKSVRLFYFFDEPPELPDKDIEDQSAYKKSQIIHFPEVSNVLEPAIG